MIRVVQIVALAHGLRAIAMWTVVGALTSGLPISAMAEKGGPQLFHARLYELSANTSLVSDYIFRGETLSGGKPAIQGGFDYEHRKGPFVGTWASSGSKELPLEIDLYGGYEPQITENLFLEATLTGYVYPHKLDDNSVEIMVALYPSFVGVAYHYDFVLNQHYTEAGVRYERGRWWGVGRGGIVVWKEQGQSRPGGSPLPPEEKAAWDWEVKAGFGINDALHVTAGITGHEFEGERAFVTFGGTFPLLDN